MLETQLRERPQHPTTLESLFIALSEEWDRLPESLFARLWESMPSRLVAVVKAWGHSTKYPVDWANEPFQATFLSHVVACRDAVSKISEIASIFCPPPVRRLARSHTRHLSYEPKGGQVKPKGGQVSGHQEDHEAGTKRTNAISRHRKRTANVVDCMSIEVNKNRKRGRRTNDMNARGRAREGESEW